MKESLGTLVPVLGGVLHALGGFHASLATQKYTDSPGHGPFREKRVVGK